MLDFRGHWFERRTVVLDYQLVRDQRDELAVRGFFVLAVHVKAEQLVDVLYLAPRPTDFYRMADRTLDL